LVGQNTIVIMALLRHGVIFVLSNTQERFTMTVNNDVSSNNEEWNLE